MKHAYEKAIAKVVLFDNSDVITTSGIDELNDDQPCETPGWDKGNGCKDETSGKCPGQAWK